MPAPMDARGAGSELSIVVTQITRGNDLCRARTVGVIPDPTDGILRSPMTDLPQARQLDGVGFTFNQETGIGEIIVDGTTYPTGQAYMCASATAVRIRVLLDPANPTIIAEDRDHPRSRQYPFSQEVRGPSKDSNVAEKLSCVVDAAENPRVQT